MIPFSPVYLVPLGFVVFGSPFVAIGAISKRKNTAVGRWPRVKGRIISSEQRITTGETRDTFRNWGPNSTIAQGSQMDVRTYCSADARFSYEVNGKTYEGQMISREGISGERAPSWVDRHPPGTEVDVYVDPSDPARAYLEWKRWTAGTIIMFAMGGALMFIGLLVFVIFLLVGG